MITVRPEDRNKALALGGAVTVVASYFCLVVIPRIRSSAVDPGAATPGSAPAPPAARPMPPPAAASALDLFATTSAPATTTADPFTPPGGLSKSTGRVTPTTISLRPGSTTLPAMGPAIGPALAGGDARAAGAMGILKKPGQPFAPAASEIVLQGVIAGDSPVGVFRIGDQMYFKHVGESVGAGLVLARVSDSGVTLKRGAQWVALELGHSSLSVTSAPKPEPSALPSPPEGLPAPGSVNADMADVTPPGGAACTPPVRTAATRRVYLRAHRHGRRSHGRRRHRMARVRRSTARYGHKRFTRRHARRR